MKQQVIKYTYPAQRCNTSLQDLNAQPLGYTPKLLDHDTPYKSLHSGVVKNLTRLNPKSSGHRLHTPTPKAIPIEKCGLDPTSKPGIDPTLNRVPTSTIILRLTNFSSNVGSIYILSCQCIYIYFFIFRKKKFNLAKVT